MLGRLFLWGFAFAIVLPCMAFLDMPNYSKNTFALAGESQMGWIWLVFFFLCWDRFSTSQPLGQSFGPFERNNVLRLTHGRRRGGPAGHHQAMSERGRLTI